MERGYLERLLDRITTAKPGERVDLRAVALSVESRLVVLGAEDHVFAQLEWLRDSTVVRFGKAPVIAVSGRLRYGLPDVLPWDVILPGSGIRTPHWLGPFPVVNPDLRGHFFSVTAVERLPLRAVPVNRFEPVYDRTSLVGIRLVSRTATAWLDECGLLWVARSRHVARTASWTLVPQVLGRLDLPGSIWSYSLAPGWFTDPALRQRIQRVSVKTTTNGDSYETESDDLDDRTES